METQQHQTEQRQVTEGRPETGWAHYILEAFGISAFFVLALFMGMDIYRGMMAFGYSWLLPILAILAYLAADFFSGFVHFLADNFGSSETPIIGPNFVGAFREHHVDPKGITTHDFIDTNGNNSLASLPFMLLAWLLVPIETTVFGYFFAAFFLLLCFAVFLTNQFHKWAHMEEPPPVASWLQRRGLILSKNTTTSTTRAPTTPTTASPSESGTRCWTGPGSSSAPKDFSAASSQARTPNSGSSGREASTSKKKGSPGTGSLCKGYFVHTLSNAEVPLRLQTLHSYEN